MIATRYLSKKMVVVINRLSMRMTDGGLCTSETNMRQGAGLGFVEHIYNNDLFGQRIYPDIFHQAAAYLFFITKNHVFMDGNKRTGLACAITFLQWNNIMFDPFDEDAVFDFVVGVAGGESDPDTVIPRVARWLEEMSRECAAAR